MKCNLKKEKPLSERDRRKIIDALTTVKCCKCGEDICVMSLAYVSLHFDKNMYKNKLCDRCKKECSE